MVCIGHRSAKVSRHKHAVPCTNAHTHRHRHTHIMKRNGNPRPHTETCTYTDARTCKTYEFTHALGHSTCISPIIPPKSMPAKHIIKIQNTCSAQRFETHHVALIGSLQFLSYIVYNNTNTGIIHGNDGHQDLIKCSSFHKV
jgi:hypothetical protein